MATDAERVKEVLDELSQEELQRPEIRALKAVLEEIIKEQGGCLELLSVAILLTHLEVAAPSISASVREQPALVDRIKMLPNDLLHARVLRAIFNEYEEAYGPLDPKRGAELISEVGRWAKEIKQRILFDSVPCRTSS